MRQQIIHQIEPWIGQEELDEVTEVLKSTFVTEGKKTAEFEKKFAEMTGARYAIAVCNGTMGLFMALKALGIGSGAEVIIPDFTFIATVNSVIMAQATPKIVDVDRKTFNLDPAKTEEHISNKTKAIMPVHIYGQAADMDETIRMAKKHNLFVIEDAAQGVGVRFNGVHVGTIGDIGVFSLYGNKTITTGEGGVITTNDKEFTKRCLQLKNHGRTTKGTFTHESVGFNFCFTDLQAAIGLAQLDKLDSIIENKKRILETYREKLSNIDGITFPMIDRRCENVYWFSNILLDNPEALSRYLQKEGIETRRFFYPMHMQPCYKIEGAFPVSEELYNKGLSLPSSAFLKEQEIDFICDKIRLFFKG